MFLLKDKLRHIKNFKSLSKNQFKSSILKLEVVRSTSLTGARSKTFIEKTQRQSKEII